MPHYLMVKYSISNYEQWQKVFDDTKDFRADAGFHSTIVMRSIVNPLEITVMCQMEDVNRARTFVESSQVREMLMSSGITNIPDFVFLTTD